MTRAFGDDQFERELREILDERAEEVASRARSVAEMTVAITPRLITPSRASARLPVLRLIALAALVLLLVGLVVIGSRPTRAPVHLQLAVQLPLTGEPAAPPVLDAVRLALKGTGHERLVNLVLTDAGVYDDSAGGAPDPETAADNMSRIASDPQFVAVIGPFNSFVARPTIPIANAAGLVQCSPSNTAPGLTLGAEAAELRPRPDRPTYVRLAATDETTAVAAAELLAEHLENRRAFVVTTVEPWAGGRTDVFVQAFEDLGGTITGRGFIGPDGDDPGKVARQIRASPATAVFFDGPAADGAAVLAALSQAGTDMPFVGLDIIVDGPRSTTNSFLDLAGEASRNAYGVFPTGADPEIGPRVAAAYEAAYGHPPEHYVLSGHACASILVDAISQLAGSLDPSADWREAIRAEVTAGKRFATAVGTVSFDPNGDARPERVSIYRGDPDAGDWVFWSMLELGRRD